MATITHNGTEIGFGSPTITNGKGAEQGIYDSGFGAPSFITVDGDDYTNSAEESFGDPYTNLTITIEGEGEYLYVPDDGGMVLQAKGSFTKLLTEFGLTFDNTNHPIGPWKVEMISQDPGGTNYVCFSGLPILGRNIFTNTNQKQMYFSIPSMLKGDYTLRFTYNRIYTFDYSKTVKVIHRLRNDKELSIKNNVPNYWNVGVKSDNIIPGVQYNVGKTETTLSVLLRAIATSFNEVYNSDYTVSTQQFDFNNTIMNVESTLSFPESGTFETSSGQLLSYTSKTATSFRGITGCTNIVPKNEKIFLPNTEQLKIEDYYKLQNNLFYFPKANVRKDDFLNAVNIIEFNERAAEQVIFQYLYQVFRNLNYVRTATITGSVISEPTVGTWNCSHVQRVCKINEKFYFILNDTLSVDGQLILDEIGSSYWTGAINSNQPTGFDGSEFEIEILPWIVERDSRGIFEITLEKSLFDNTEGYIDKDFIDFNIFIDGLDFDNNVKQNLNLDLFVASGIIEKIGFKRRCDESFGTYYHQSAAPDGFKILPDYEY